MSETHSFRLGELFCGPGGIGRGAKMASETLAHQGLDSRIIHTWATDYHQDSCRTYQRNFPDLNPANVYCEDIRAFDLDKVPEFDALTFGFPCNDFSAVGRQKGFDGEFGPLYSYGVSMLRLRRPRWFLAENVSGLRTSANGAELQQILRELRDSGYTVTPHLYKFEEYGVPQARHRIIIVGIRDDEGLEFRVPAPTHQPHEFVTAGEALMRAYAPGTTHRETRALSKAVSDRLQLTRPGENVFQMQNRIGVHQLVAHGITPLNVKGATLSNIYKRLHPERPAYTVTGSGGGGTHMYHWQENRALSNRERARLQTFPDDHDFAGGRDSVRRQIGMAVPPLGVARIFEAVLMTFRGIDYEHVPRPNIEMPSQSFLGLNPLIDRL